MKPAAIILFALLVIIAGMFLLAKTKKEDLGRFFKFISYTVVISGFAIILIVIQLSIIRMVGHCRNNFMHKVGCNKEMPFPPPCDHKMMMMNDDMMDGNNKIIKKIEIVGNDKCGMMKMEGNTGCEMGPGCMMKMGSNDGCKMETNCMMKMENDKGCGTGMVCNLKCLSPQERSMIIAKRISDKVSLTADQLPKVQALILDISNKKDALMKSGNDDPIKMEGLIKKHRQESLDALKKLLTPAQIKLLPEDFPL